VDLHLRLYRRAWYSREPKRRGGEKRWSIHAVMLIENIDEDNELLKMQAVEPCCVTGNWGLRYHLGQFPSSP
jgi:hypothetical protein